jgi:hypothetical protein
MKVRTLVTLTEVVLKATRSKDKQLDFLFKCVKDLYQRVTLLEKGFIVMANDFSALDAALAGVEQAIRDVAAAIANPAVDNNDQATIDAITARLGAAADALAAAKAAEDVEDGVAAPAA